MTTPFLAGNWKMHGTLAAARQLAQAVAQASAPGVRIAVFPPFVHLAAVAEALKGSPVELGAQNCYGENQGAFTGEVSPVQLKDAGCGLVLIGHSERRHVMGETDEMVAKKLKAALAAGLEPVFCLGETLAEREAGKTSEVLGRQARASLGGLAPAELARLTVAYEPVWAIGTGKTATPEQARQAHSLIRAAVSGIPRILYGGSVKPDNLASLLGQAGVDGALVGGASLDAAAFAAMIRTAAGRTA